MSIQKKYAAGKKSRSPHTGPRAPRRESSRPVKSEVFPLSEIDHPIEKEATPISSHTPCPLYRKCGGCQLQNMDYARQLHWKQEQVQRLLGKYGKVQPIIGMEHPFHYRNKVQAAFAWDKSRKKIVSGVYQSSTHRVVPVESCMTEDETADKIIGAVRRMMPGFHMTPYDEVTGKGFLRHVLVRRGFTTGQVMVVMVTATPVFPAKNNFCRALRQEFPEITTIVQNLNDRFTSMVLGEQEKVLYGPGYIEDVLCGCTFRISPRSFYQINPVQTETLYRTALEHAGLTGKETVLDAYCGVGTIGLAAAKLGAGRVIGVEVNRDAVRDAIANAKTSGVQNARFYCADAGEFMVGMAQSGETVDVVIMDPPRAGSDEAFLSSVCRLAPQKLVYISCNPETQARDIRYLVSHGWKVEFLQPVDMFPHTNHIENIVVLQGETK